jgi:hypothetical protein
VIIPPILICERRLGDPRVTFIPTQSIYERAPGDLPNLAIDFDSPDVYRMDFTFTFKPDQKKTLKIFNN